MNLRPAEPGDKHLLQGFRCCDLTPYAHNLEWWIRRKANGWGHHDIRHRLRLLLDDDGRLMGVYGWEHGDRIGYWFVRFLAIDNECKGREYGPNVLAACVAEIGEFDPDGYAYWRVDARNRASLRMCEKVGAEIDHDASNEKYVWFVIQP